MKSQYLKSKLDAIDSKYIAMLPMSIAMEQLEIKKRGGLKITQLHPSREARNYSMFESGTAIQKRVNKHANFAVQEAYAFGGRKFVPK